MPARSQTTASPSMVASQAGAAAAFAISEHDPQAFLWVFDLLELDGEDFRPIPLFERRAALRRLLRRAKAGMTILRTTAAGLALGLGDHWSLGGLNSSVGPVTLSRDKEPRASGAKSREERPD
jgi:hypothetical protein